MAGTFRSRFTEAKEIRDLRWVDIAKRSGLDKAQISQYKNGKHIPEPDTLYKLAIALNVSVTWLMGHDTPMETSSNFHKQITNTYGQGAVELLSIFSKLDDAGKQAALKKVGDLLNCKYLG